MSGGESDKICKDGASKSNIDDVCDVIGKLQNMSAADREDIALSVCANCGKEGRSDNMNTCNKCKVTTYCNAVCKKVHKKKHKKQCEELIRLATEKHDEELKLAAELHDAKLFKQPPPAEECPICFQQLPALHTGWGYYSCCGKVICSGCIHAPLYDNQGNKVDNKKCPFCRTPHATDAEIMERFNKRVELEDPLAIFNLGCDYRDERSGYTQNYTKALELWHRAAELGHSNAYNSIGIAYQYGRGIEVDEKKALHYYELAAMGGNGIARYNLGVYECNTGNVERALKHFMIAVRGGYNNSLNKINELYKHGHATKEDYKEALQSYQAYLGEIKSSQRDKAAAADEDCCYY